MTNNPPIEEFDIDQDTIDLLSEALGLYQKEIDSRRPEDYEVFLPNMKKFMGAYTYLSQIAEKCGGSIEKLKFDRREINGGITAYFTVLYLSGDDVVRFCDFIKEAQSISIDSLVDGRVCLSMTFKDIFKKIK